MVVKYSGKLPSCPRSSTRWTLSDDNSQSASSAAARSAFSFGRSSASLWIVFTAATSELERGCISPLPVNVNLVSQPSSNGEMSICSSNQLPFRWPQWSGSPGDCSRRQEHCQKQVTQPLLDLPWTLRDIHEVFKDAPGCLAERLGRSHSADTRVGPLQEPDPLRCHMADNLRRVCRTQELAVRKRLLQSGKHVALPARMKVEVDFINQYHSSAVEWIVQCRISPKFQRVMLSKLLGNM